MQWTRLEGSFLTFVLVFIEMLQTVGIEAGRTADNAMDIIPLFEQKLGPEVNVITCSTTIFC